MNTKLVSSFVTAMVLATVVSANPAQALDTKRTQFVTSLAIDRPFADSDFGWRSNIFSFQAPGVTNIYFFYAGLTYKKPIGNWDFWTSPQIVGVANFFADRDAVGPALWVSFSNRWLKFFLEPEVYFGSEGRKGYYGYYSASFKPVPSVGIGGQLEQVYNQKLSNQFGPHVAVTKDIVTVSASWFVDPQQKFQQLRLMFGLGF